VGEVSAGATLEEEAGPGRSEERIGALACAGLECLLTVGAHSLPGVRLVTWTTYRLSSIEPCFDAQQ
jgi:hypothetical protein